MINLQKINLPSNCNKTIANRTLLRLHKYNASADLTEPSKLTIKELHALCGKKNSARVISNRNSKMPGYTLSTSAHACKVGGKLHQVEGTICKNCYALKGNYIFPNVVSGLMTASIAIAYYDHKKDYEPWIVALSELIRRRCIVKDIKDAEGNKIGSVDNTFFRFHDSGDLQSPLHLAAINQVALNNPSVSFWLPTREMRMVKLFLQNNTIANNLCIRLSAYRFGESPMSFGLGLPTSTVEWPDSKHNCIAPKQGGSCDGEIAKCRNCWDPKIPNVNYKRH